LKVHYSAEARSDLLEIATWIAYDNPVRAASFSTQLRTACEALGTTPRAYAILPEFRGHQIRRRPFRNYLIFYRIGATAVEILHILHGARDYKAILERSH
jgi:plasmid stabilization system protein ParE